MDLWYPGAERRPLGKQTETEITPRILVIHTMVGSLRGTDGMFARSGYTGTESHFGIGGPGDGSLDGKVYQWQSLNFSADAQATGNAYCTSVETADDANPNNPWSDRQIATIVELGTWWAQQIEAPARIVTSVQQKGFGYHRQFGTWNPNKHECPGNVRLRQYTNVVLPAIAARLAGKTPPKPAAPVLTRVLRRGDTGADVRQLQQLLAVVVDGAFGPITEAALETWQRKKGLAVDGVFGPASCRAAGWTWKKA